MNKKLVTLLSLVGVLVLVTFLSIKKVASALENNGSVATGEKVTEVTDSSVEELKTKEKTVFEEEQVVKEEIVPQLDMTSGTLSEDALPKGTVVSVKPVENNEEWVEIDSNPAKGFIEKKYLEPRHIHITEREAKRTQELSSNELTASLDTTINQFVADHGGDISVYVETTDGNYTYGYGEDKVRRTASSIKLPFIAYVMTLVDQKQLDLNTQLTYTAGFKIDGTGIIQFEPIGTQYTIKQLAELVIRYSDNVAYLMLLSHVGEQQFINFLHELDPTSPNNRVFSTSHILTKAMKYVYDRKDSSENINQLYEWMQQSTFDDGVDVGLPGVDVVHKTGWMPMYTVSNDIALVKDEKNPYYITIMTSGYDDSYSEKSISDLSWLIDEQMLKLK
ncbi:MAG: serine hydrolase [Vagococcus sp.]|uniref:serine hydrolase n=1 Tax=Vagococcus TaxID=2737 RepID=UPI002FC790FB